MWHQSVSKAKFYIAPCWLIRQIADLASSGMGQPTIMLFDREMGLNEGLSEMEQNGWKLVEVQSNHTKSHRELPRWLLPDFYYLFEKGHA